MGVLSKESRYAEIGAPSVRVIQEKEQFEIKVELKEGERRRRRREERECWDGSFIVDGVGRNVLFVMVKMDLMGMSVSE